MFFFSADVDVVALLLLPILLDTAPVQTKKSKGGAYRPIKQEVGESFLLHADTITQFDEQLNARKERCVQYKWPVQPVAGFVGPLEKPTKCIVVVNDTRYYPPTPLKAVDACFQGIHTLSAQPPPESAHVHGFLSKFVYCLKESERQAASVYTLASDLGL